MGKLEFDQKKLLILAGADVHCKIVRAAKRMKIYTIVTDYLSLEESPAKRIADEAWQYDINDVDTIVERCLQEKVDGVIAFCIDPAQIPYQRICEKLGFPCFGTREQFEIMTNKRKFKDYCREHGLDVIPEYTESDVRENRVKYPILVKPSDSRGSRGQTVCWRKEEVEGALEIARLESGDGGVLLEQYMHGEQDMSFAYMVINTIPYLLKIGDRYLGKPEDNLERHQICSILPSLSTDWYKEKVEPKVLKMIADLGITYGAVFLQGFAANDHVYFYDPGMRFPGSDYDLVLQYATGFDPMTSMIRFALTGDRTCCVGNPIDAYKMNGGICMVLAIVCRPGIIAQLNGFEEIEQNKYVFSVSRRSKIGDVIPNTGAIEQRVAEIVAYLPKREEEAKFVEFVYSKIEILDEAGEDMIVSRMGRDISFERFVPFKRV